MSDLHRRLTRRDLGAVVLLCVVTLTLYGFYWVPKLAEDVNRVIEREKYSFGVVLLVGIVTLGLGLCVFEILFAYDLQKSARYRALPQANPNLGGIVLTLNVIAILLSIVTAGIALVLSLVLGVWATWKVQDAINDLAAAAPEGQWPDGPKSAPAGS